MERIIPRATNPILLAEHEHRYELAARYARGRVLDCGCGLGYGARFIAAQDGVTRYIGVDIDLASVTEAASQFGSAGLIYACCDGESLPFGDNVFDTVISLETLEHCEHPDKLMSELGRVLAPGGVAVISVPSATHEDFCTAQFGANEFHRTKFTLNSLNDTINQHVELKAVLATELVVYTSVRPILSPQDEAFYGSFLAIASKGSSNLDVKDEDLLEGPPYIIGHADAVRELCHALKATEALVTERDKAIRGYQLIEADLRAALAHSENLVSERDQEINRNVSLIAELKGALATAEGLVAERDKAIRGYQLIEADLRAALAHSENLVSERDQEINRNVSLIAELKGALATAESMIVDRDAAIEGYKRIEAELRLAYRECEQRLTEALKQNKAFMAEAVALRQEVAELRARLANAEERLIAQLSQLRLLVKCKDGE